MTLFNQDVEKEARGVDQKLALGPATGQIQGLAHRIPSTGRRLTCGRIGELAGGQNFPDHQRHSGCHSGEIHRDASPCPA